MYFRQKHIEGESVMTDHAPGLLDGHFDLLIVVPSWDSRCVVITKCSGLSADDCIFLLFPGRDPGGLRDEYEAILAEFTRRCCGRIIEVKGPSLSLEETWRALWDAIRSKAESAGRPLTIAVDLSTFPRFYSLAAIAGCLQLGYVSSISVLYSKVDPFVKTILGRQ